MLVTDAGLEAAKSGTEIRALVLSRIAVLGASWMVPGEARFRVRKAWFPISVIMRACCAGAG